MSKIFDSQMHLDSALHLINETRFLLESENPDFKLSSQALDLDCAQDYLSAVFESLTDKLPTGVDLSAHIKQARFKIYEREQVKTHNNQMKLRLVNYSQRLADELKAVLTENGFADFRIEVSDNETEYGKTNFIKVYRSDGKDYSLVWVKCSYDSRHKLPCGETALRVRDEIKMYCYGNCTAGVDCHSIAEFIKRYPENVAKFIDWLMS